MYYTITVHWVVDDEELPVRYVSEEDCEKWDVICSRPSLMISHRRHPRFVVVRVLSLCCAVLMVIGRMGKWTAMIVAVFIFTVCPEGVILIPIPMLLQLVAHLERCSLISRPPFTSSPFPLPEISLEIPLVVRKGIGWLRSDTNDTSGRLYIEGRLTPGPLQAAG
jgi:hypothetical protein